MANKKNWLGILAIVPTLGGLFGSCVSSYHIQSFSNDVITLPAGITEWTSSDGKVYQKETTEGTFSASNYESALQKAEKAGFSEILSIEYGTYQVLFIIGVKWVTIRCTKDYETIDENDQTNDLTGGQTRARSTASQPGRRTNEASAVPQLGEPTIFQQGLNLLPAVPIGGKNLKFEFGGDTWIAKVNGGNFLAGNCIFEETNAGYILTLKATNVWTGAVGDVIDLLQTIGIPLGPAAGPLRTAARLAARVAKWIPLKESDIVLEYNEGPPASLRFAAR